MRVGVIGGGITGLTVGYELLKKGYAVTIIEKEDDWGGLAAAFEVLPGVSLERFYHHLFTNDFDILNLCRELNVMAKLNTLKGKTAILSANRIYPFDSPLSVLGFTPLSVLERLRFGVVTAYLRFFASPESLEGRKASTWLRSVYGERIYSLLWEPLLVGKFDGVFKEISLVWFWARIKKRTEKLIYPAGGFQTLIDGLVRALTDKGAILVKGAKLEKLERKTDGWSLVFKDGQKQEFEKLVSTVSLKAFVRLVPELPDSYKKQLEEIRYLNAHVLILVLTESLTDYYWININDASFPFLVLGEQSNLLGREAYAGKTVVYLGNYLPDGDPRLSMSESQLLDLYEPHLKRINNRFNRTWVEKAVRFVGACAQPVVDVGYRQKIPGFKTPLTGLYIATMAQVYPWDRGTNYAVKLAQDLVRQNF